MSDPTATSDSITSLQRLTDPAVQGAMQSDAELLTLFVESGSRAAMETLIQRYAGMVASVCRCTVADPSSAEDAFQATFLVLLKSAKKIQSRSSLAAWLHGVAYRAACRLRKQRLASIAGQSPDEVMSSNQANEDPINVLARKLELEALDQELEKLPERLREILIEHYLLGHTAPQIAARTALSVSAVEGRIRRGRYALLRQLARRGISLTVLVAASNWFQQHLRAAEAKDWSNAFLDSYLPTDTNPTDVDFEADSDIISSLVRGEMNMLKASMTKAIYSAGATLLVGGVLAFNLFGDGNRPSAGRSKSDEVGATLPTIPDESPSIVAQLSVGGFQTRNSSDSDQQTGKPAVNQNTSGTVSQSPPNGVAASTVDASAQAAAEQGPREPIPWTVAAGEPPSWLRDSEHDQAERALREKVRTKLRETITVDLEVTRLSDLMDAVSKMIDIPITIDTKALSDIGASPDAPVSLKGEMSVREVLRRALKHIENADTGLAYVVQDSNIEITSRMVADEEPSIRYYDLAYVLPNDANLRSVVNAIEQSISPESWSSLGGNYTISPVGSMLIVSCDEVSHQKIELMLSSIAAMNKANLEKATPNLPQNVNAGGGMGGMF